MLSLDSVAAFVTSIDPSPNHSLLAIIPLFSSQIAVETRYLARFGVVGVLPFATYLNGDLLALRAVPGQPPTSWNVVRVSHIGEGCRTVCSRLSRLMPALLQADKNLPHQQALKIYRDGILLYSDWLGDQEGVTRAVLDQLRDETVDSFTPLPEFPFHDADPGSALARFADLYEQAVATPPALTPLWREAVQVDSNFAPAQTLLFKALLAGADDDAIRRTAWDVFMLNHAVDNLYMSAYVRHPQSGWSQDNPLVVAAQTLLERGFPPEADTLQALFLPVVQALVADEEAYDGAAHLAVAQQLHLQNRHDLAFIACQNAIYWRSFSQEATYSEALAYALTIARDWQQADLVRLLEMAQPEEATPTLLASPSAPPIALPREVEWTSIAVTIMEQLNSGANALLMGDSLLIHRYERWCWLSMGYIGGDRGISTLAILQMFKLANLIGSFSPDLLETSLKPFDDLPRDWQQELRYKLLPEISDYHFLVERNFISITGGATSDDITTPQFALEQKLELTTHILKGEGGGWFQFWRTWAEIEQAMNERS